MIKIKEKIKADREIVRLIFNLLYRVETLLQESNNQNLTELKNFKNMCDHIGPSTDIEKVKESIIFFIKKYDEVQESRRRHVLGNRSW
ncbi:hypothetical protein [uncultured Fusobacterium sp.]|uniref:hypothetical protein n=1 Tax=uncultured Fusobacterium sp. TaxID=159267 RepID=UPI0025FF9465|nr:hypothetical protein [uncultured Fusobacterium sp.]